MGRLLNVDPHEAPHTRAPVGSDLQGPLHRDPCGVLKKGSQGPSLGAPVGPS